MLKKELTAALAILGAIAPFSAHADQTMPTGGSGQQPTYTAGEMLRKGNLPAGYNQSAAYDVDNSWDVFFTADFIWWCLQQETVRVGVQTTPTSSGALGLLTGSDTTVFADPAYKPGFQVGLGFNMHGMDDWQLYSEYTWYQNTTTTTASGKVATTATEVSAVSGVTDDVIIATSASLESKFYFNNLNVMLQRPFYWGRKLTANFGWGLRALWLSQRFSGSASNLTSYPAGASSELAVSGSLTSTFHQKSWGLGPRFAFDTNWLLGWGFRFMADAAASVMYTRYTHLDGTLNGGGTYGVTANLSTNSSTSYNTLRAVTETALGLGWGSYFGDNNDFHFDLSASYEFNVYWNQNMFGMVMAGDGAPGNTYLHGLNIAARFDF